LVYPFCYPNCSGARLPLAAKFKRYSLIVAEAVRWIGHFEQPDFALWAFFRQSGMKAELMEPMRRRPSSRLLVIDQNNRVLLFRFAFKCGPLTGHDYWATPGGALEAGENFADAARRELFEETGILRDAVGPEVAEREFVVQLHDGEYVMAEERLYLVRVADQSLSWDYWNPHRDRSDDDRSSPVVSRGTEVYKSGGLSRNASCHAR
jgi:8-oxo-dGTP diphosphatase